MTALLLDYQMAREDDRAAQSVLSTLYGVAITLLAALIAALVGNYPLPREALAIAPLLPFSAISYVVLMNSNMTMRSFYLRALEEELRTRLFANINLTILNGVKPMSGQEFIVSVASGVRGRLAWRIAYAIMQGTILVLFGGVTIFIGYRVGGIYAFIMLVFYAPLALILAIEGVTVGIAGRSAFQAEIDRFKADGYASIRRLGNLQSVKQIGKRKLHSYLLFPRPGDLIKWSFIPVSALLGLLLLNVFNNFSSRDLRVLLVGWLAFEYLVYQARYQINDVRNLAEDLDHPKECSRMRLPVHEFGIHASVNASLAAVAVRLVVLILILILNPFDVREELGTAALAAVVFTIPYEYLRARKPKNPNTAHRLVIQIWIIAGGGYAIRVCLGLSLVGIKSPAVLAIFSISAWLFGIMFVTMTWVLEATSYLVKSKSGYLVKSESGKYYCLSDHGNEVSKERLAEVQFAPDKIELAEKSHILHLLPFIKLHAAGNDTLTEGVTDCSKTKYLESRPTLLNPWNLALLGAASLSVIACDLAAPSPKFDAGDSGILIITILGFLILSTMKSTLSRWGVLAAVLASILGLSMALSVNYRWAALLALLTFGTIYSLFAGLCYYDLVSFNERVAKQVSLAMRAAFRVLVGRATFDRMFSQEQNGADSTEEADRQGSNLVRGRRDSIQ